MIGLLPEVLEVSGIAMPIDADFRNVLAIFEAFADNELSDEDKVYICIQRLYKCEVPEELTGEAINCAFRFLDGGDIPKSEPSEVRTLDWKHDEGIIFPAVNKCAGFEVRSCDFLHWWTFLGYFGEVGEGLLTTILNIRRKKAAGKNLDKWEIEFLQKNKELVVLRTAEEEAEIAETVAFLNELL